jgi:hypothetical protein
MLNEEQENVVSQYFNNDSDRIFRQNLYKLATSSFAVWNGQDVYPIEDVFSDDIFSKHTDNSFVRVFSSQYLIGYFLFSDDGKTVIDRFIEPVDPKKDLDKFSRRSFNKLIKRSFARCYMLFYRSMKSYIIYDKKELGILRRLIQKIMKKTNYEYEEDKLHIAFVTMGKLGGMEKPEFIIIVNDKSKHLKENISKALRPICQLDNTINVFTKSEL